MGENVPEWKFENAFIRTDKSVKVAKIFWLYILFIWLVVV